MSSAIAPGYIIGGFCDLSLPLAFGGGNLCLGGCKQSDVAAHAGTVGLIKRQYVPEAPVFCRTLIGIHQACGEHRPVLQLAHTNRPFYGHALTTNAHSSIP